MNPTDPAAGRTLNDYRTAMGFVRKSHAHLLGAQKSYERHVAWAESIRHEISADAKLLAELEQIDRELSPKEAT